MVKPVGQQVDAFGHIKRTRMVCLLFFCSCYRQKWKVSSSFNRIIFNKLGYNIEFTNEGEFEEYTIDLDSLAEHLLALKRAAEHHEIKIWRVIFNDQLQKTFCN